MFFAAHDSNLLATGIADLIREQYSCGQVHHCSLHHRGVNDTFIMRRVGAAPLFFRVYSANWRSDAQIASELAIIEHLARNGVRVSLPLPTRNGEVAIPLVCVEGRRCGVLFESAPGTVVAYEEYSQLEAEWYGKGIGMISRAMATYSGPRVRPSLDTYGLIKGPIRSFGATLSKVGRDPTFFIDAAQLVSNRVEALGSLEMAFCHGDLHGQNGSLSGHEFTYYDFDCCGWGFFGYELSVFPWVLFLRNMTEERILTLTASYLKGVMHSRKVQSLDIGELFTFVMAREIWYLGLQADLADKLGWAQFDQSFIRRHTSILLRLQQHYVRKDVIGWLLQDPMFKHVAASRLV